ncbi:hypothetical protein FACS1894139_12950 [Planctomycetales bacterium]|nr:hypothetical protein FACS1894107_05850 [Planctomycetales bacterium]GHT06638.1 hypothetical protein FACS1894139_12950 [Planctomycetales bacterium]GHV23009.1 hypothetical protein AGMMS49959_14910 [Planctomycetales bacterium]
MTTDRYARGTARGAAVWAKTVAVLPLLLIVGLSGYGAWHLWQRALTDERFAVRNAATIDDRTLAAEAKQELSALGNFAAGKNLLHPQLAATVRAAYEKSAWVKEVRRVERVFPNQLVVEFVPRRPFLQARDAGGEWLLDDENVLIAASAQTRPWLPVVTGDIKDCPPAGAVWRDLAPAFRATRALTQSKIAAQLPVKEIVLKRAAYYDKERQARQSRPRLEITTHNNIHILWGADDVPGEITAQDKITMLAQLLAQPPRCNRRYLSLDVRTAVPGYTLRKKG